MQILHLFDNKKFPEQLTLGIGKFDGVHLGHRKIIKLIVENAKSCGTVPSVFTFRHFPAEFYICSWQEKLSIFKECGVQLCIWADFEDISFWQPEKFLNSLVNMNVSQVVVGFNFFFGAHRKGDISFLRTYCAKENVSLFVAEPVQINGVVINSTNIRNCLESGNVESANIFLGRRFSFTGKVITGDFRGRTLHFPTANLYLSNNVKIGNGVYAGLVLLENHTYRIAINIGDCPTFGGKQKKIEVYIIDFSGDIYGKILTVYLAKKLRDEIAFVSPEKLVLQIKKDIRACQKIKLTI